MPDDKIARWTVSVSRETDISVRSFLARLSKFIEDAVKWRVFDQSIAEARSKVAHVPAKEMDAMIDEAVAWARQPHAIETH